MLVGSFLGDYIKGRLKGEHGDAVERGIRLHRAIDAFTDQSSLARKSRQRFDKQYYRYGGIMTDVIFDHLLARSWRQYYDTELEEFSKATLQMIMDHEHLLFDPALSTARRMHQYNSLAGYGNAEFVERSFAYLAGKLKRQNPLADAFDQYLWHKSGLTADFHQFYPELMAFCDDWKQSH